MTGLRALATPSGDSQSIVLVGNPNVGKSVIFGLLTGRYVTVSNYPGTTVEVSQGYAAFEGGDTSRGGHRWRRRRGAGHRHGRTLVIDTPGINNLIPMSEDERVTRDILLHGRPKAVVQVADAKNLRRALLISLQLAEMGLPFVLDLNMEDEARSRGIFIDVSRLADILGVEVVSTVATQRQGIGRLIHSLAAPRPSSYRLTYDEPIEEGIAALVPLLARAVDGHGPRRALALMLLAGDESLTPWLHEHLDAATIQRIETLRQEVQARYAQPLSYVINRQRLRAVDNIMAQVYSAEKAERESLAGTLGRLTMHPLWGVPILLLVLYLIYKFVGEFGAQTLVGLMEEVVFGRFVNPWATRLAEALIPIPLLRDFLVGQYGLITMALSYGLAIILPIVGTFFIAFGLLEDSGYLPRLAVMVNRLFRVMGLNGKAVLPMILGLGCDTMATMTTRILETRKERLQVTLLLALGVPCSAQLGVILGMMGGLGLRAILLWAGMVAGVLMTVGYLAARVIPGHGSDFILELPPLRVPQASNIAVKTLARVEWYLKEVVPLFILGTALLFALDRLGLLAVIEKLAAPLVVGFLGLPPKATEAFLIGFLRRDYGAAGLFMLARAGEMDHLQIVVSLVTITLFVPCIANFFMIIKEQGLKTSLVMVAFIFPFAFLVGGLLNLVLRAWGVGL
ncbi:MAG: ferrous iron transport protein B [Anaerolineae bacterium]